ncbi:MAG TPA: AlpA family phage regulatory protein [Alphaproteobacteria bacterium]|nr:AlpA family phage regulatory protein [Alphaproteobacteria bacterium]
MEAAQKLQTDSHSPIYIRQADLIPAVIPISSATLWRWVKAKTFPAPVKLGPRITAWRWDDVQAWMRDRENL